MTNDLCGIDHAIGHCDKCKNRVDDGSVFGVEYDAVSNIMAYEDGQLNEDETVALFQYLVDTGMAWTLQGMYGRQAQRFIQAGLVTRRKP